MDPPRRSTRSRRPKLLPDNAVEENLRKPPPGIPKAKHLDEKSATVLESWFQSNPMISRKNQREMATRLAVTQKVVLDWIKEKQVKCANDAGSQSLRDSMPSSVPAAKAPPTKVLPAEDSPEKMSSANVPPPKSHLVSAPSPSENKTLGVGSSTSEKKPLSDAERNQRGPQTSPSRNVPENSIKRTRSRLSTLSSHKSISVSVRESKLPPITSQKPPDSENTPPASPIGPTTRAQSKDGRKRKLFDAADVKAQKRTRTSAPVSTPHEPENSRHLIPQEPHAPACHLMMLAIIATNAHYLEPIAEDPMLLQMAMFLHLIKYTQSFRE